MISNFEFSRIKAVAFDLDGTLYFGESAARKAREIVAFLKGKSVLVRFFTNNSARSPKFVFNKLSGMGFNVELSEVYTSTMAVKFYLTSQNATRIGVCGSDDLINYLSENFEIELNAENKIDAFVVGMNSKFNYQILSSAVKSLSQARIFLACNVDRSYSIENNESVVGCGAIVKAIEYGANREVDFVVGKPSSYMFEMLQKETGLTAEEILIVGDNLESDIALAKKVGAPFVYINNNMTIENLYNLYVEKLK